jgi:hypothetical protein
MRTILFLAANPSNSTQLRLGEEARDIEEGLIRSKQREQFKLFERLKKGNRAEGINL